MRAAPAYQEYASDILARTDYREMTLAERGLWHSMRLQCWVDHSVPKDPVRLARLLSMDVEELKKAYTPRVRAAFVELEEVLVCRELEEYRIEQTAKREHKQNAGRAGAAARHGTSSRPALAPPDRLREMQRLPNDTEDLKKAFGDDQT